MSILFGVRQRAAKQAQLGEMEQLAKATAQYAVDGTEMKADGVLGMAVQPYYTHRRSRLGSMMAEDGQGNIVSLDGRLDNVEALCEELHIDSEGTSDAEIVLRIFLAYAEESFSRFVGDWAIVLWHEPTQTLYLARDHAGTRTLHYELTEDGVLWGTYLETFFVMKPQRTLNVSYAAAFLTAQLTHLSTPYEGIHVVPPAHFVAIDRSGGTRTTPHWNWMRGDFLRYKSDREYEEHFLMLFRQAVERRTEHDDLPILAELSGGMDSSSIVCMSDKIRRDKGVSSEQLVDTVSYYDSDDPHWNEMLFVACIEEQRGKMGIHSPLPLLTTDFTIAKLSPLLPETTEAVLEAYKRLDQEIVSTGYRALLTGFGGDELLGGVTTGVPELADCLYRGSMVSFLKRGVAWCLPGRTPLVQIVRETVRFLADIYVNRSTSDIVLPPGGTKRLYELSHLYQKDFVFTCPRGAIAPSRLMNARAWWNILETLPHREPKLQTCREYRFPLLDRDLVEFLFRVPRERMLRPGRRRAMMRSAMRGIVPEDVIERRRKGYRQASVLKILSAEYEKVESVLRDSYAVSAGLIQRNDLLAAVGSLRQQETKLLTSVFRTLVLELWIRGNHNRLGIANAGA